MSRPYRQDKVDVLEQRVTDANGDTATLAAIRDELLLRKTDRAARCLERVEDLLSRVPKKEKPRSSAPEPEKRTAPEAPVEPPLKSRPAPKFTPAEPTAYPDITNAPTEILSSWVAMEVLSPQTYREPKHLAIRQGETIVPVRASKLPWVSGESSLPKRRLYYQVVLGSAHVEVAIDALLQKYGDSRIERLPVRGKVPLAIVLVDKTGRLVSPPSISISSFAWGAITALKEDLSALSAWTEKETAITAALEIFFREELKPDEDKDLPRPLDWKTIQGAYQLLCRSFDLPEGFSEPPSFAVRTYTFFADREPPEVMLLNSFFLSDLIEAHRLVGEGKAPENLRRYLGDAPRPITADLLEDVAAIRTAVSPALTPLARWPSNGRHPLVMLQQIAVNLALSEARDGGLVGVNGPPGTGKTTLLRDIVAGLVAERAIAMCRFDDPARAFHATEHSIKLDGGTVSLYELDSSLRGFEMLVASSNNKAVENVSAELPNLEAIATDADLRYFQTASNALSPQRETWGTIAAVLGNRKNLRDFGEAFWRDQDSGMNAYLAAATGACPLVVEKDAEGNTTSRKPHIVTAEKPPNSHADALKRWAVARARFQQAVQRSEAWQARLQGLEADIREIHAMESHVGQARDAFAATASRVHYCREALAEAQRVETAAVEASAKAERGHANHAPSKPGFWSRLFQTRHWKDWKNHETNLSAAISSASLAAASAKKIRVGQDAELASLQAEYLRHGEALRKSEENLSNAKARLSTAKAEGIIFTDSEFFEQSRHALNLTTPWFSAAAQRSRDDVFIEAMNLHRAFIDAAAKPLRQNINALIGIAAIKVMKDASKQSLVPSLWSSLFLVVPLVSTTFASVNRMLGKLPNESLGWLLVDEAGQALPQAMVGALMKTRRAVVVGDPLQVEPFTGLPDMLVTAIFRRFGVEPDLYAPSNGSAQTVTDLRSRFTADFPTNSGHRTVGIPLLVHRRCAEPMFSISNTVAYANLMVPAKASKPSEIKRVLGPSQWIHVEGRGVEKWCPQEGAKVIELLHHLVEASVPLNLYIVTPFVIVEEQLRTVIESSGLLRDIIPDPAIRRDWLKERVGTIHTVQGREAEAVIFVLGAPNLEQNGARIWAGKKPNLLNVAVTRAQEVVYVVGNRQLWKSAGVFSKLDAFLP